MIGIDDIENQLRLIYQFGQSMPEFVFVNRNVINNIFYEGISAGHIPNSHYGFNGFAIWVSVGRLELLPCDFISNDEAIFSHSRNILLDIFYKLGLEDDKNTLCR